MRWFSFILILLIATLLESGNLLNLFAIGGWYIRPSILITLLVYYSLACRTQDAIICAFMIGLAADITTRLIGPHMLVFGSLGLLLNQCNQILLVQRAHFKAIIIFAVYFVAQTMTHWLGLIDDVKDADATNTHGASPPVNAETAKSISAAATEAGIDMENVRVPRPVCFARIA